MRFYALVASAILMVIASLGATAFAHSTADDPPVCETKVATLDGAIPAGAYAACETRGDKSFQLTIAPEDNGNINCSAWYAFRLTPQRRSRVSIELNYTKCGHRYWPKVSTDGVNWDYVASKRVTISGEGDDKTARFSIKLKDRPVFVAGQEILPPSAYDAWLSDVSQSPAAERWLLGKSAEGRDIPAMTIADSASTQRETVVLVGRQHPPEVTGALAMLPFVEALLDDSEIAKRYRERFQTIVVPMLNPDGVVHGHWRHNTGGVDLNRDWGPFTQPETKLMQGVFQEIETDPERHLRLMIDFHSTQRDIFYTIPDELPTDPPFFTRDWLARYQERMPDYEVKRDARHTEGRPISKAYVFDTYGVPGITFELGDETDRTLIKRIGRESAIAMMETLLKTQPK